MVVTTQRHSGVRRKLRGNRTTRAEARSLVARWLAAPRYELVPLNGAADAARDLPGSATVTVTSSPARGVEATVALTEALAGLGLRPVPHLAARQITGAEQLAGICRRLTAAGVAEVFVVGGDATPPAGEFADGLSLLEGLERIGHGFARIGVPGYPEGHPKIGDEALRAALTAKARYATYIVTQMCFDPAAIVRYAESVRASGIELPVYAGVPGVVDMARLMRIGIAAGVGDSLRFARGNTAVVRHLLRPSGYRPDRLIDKLAVRATESDADIAGLHLYTFNQVNTTVAWVNQAVTRRGGQ